MKKHTPKIARPAVRWLAARTADGPMVRAWEWSTSDAVKWCRDNSAKFAGLHATADEASEALKSSQERATSENQEAVLTGGLVASVVASRRVA